MLNDQDYAQFDADWETLSNGASAQEAAADRQRQHLEDELCRLALLSPLDYDRERGSAAKKLGVQVKTLDREVAKRRPHHQPEAAATKQPPTWEPLERVWADPVAGAELLAELSGAIRRFVMLDQTAALIVALWILFTWVFEHMAENNPYLRIVSPASECGKSTLLKVIKYLARGGWLVSKITPSSFMRSMVKERHTLLLDEGDAFLHENEMMRNVLDAASDPDTANLSISVKSGDDWVSTDFNVFVPIVIASIGRLRKMETVESRGIHVHLKRATPAELKHLSKGRRSELKAALEPLAAQCARWAVDYAARLIGARPELPDDMSGREMDKWEPLIAIADAIGGEYPALALAAISATAADRQRTGDSLPVLLLGDLKTIFQDRGAATLASAEICKTLTALEDRPWAELGKARKPLTPRGLAGLLRGFGVSPGTVQLDDKSTAKGYKRSDLEDSFARYLPVAHDPNRQNVKRARGVSAGGDSQNVNADRVDGSENDTSAHGEKGFDALTDNKPPNAGEHRNSVAEDDEINRLAAADGWNPQMKDREAA